MSWSRSLLALLLIGLTVLLAGGLPNPSEACANIEQGMYLLKSQPEMSSLSYLGLDDALAYSGLQPPGTHERSLLNPYDGPVTPFDRTRDADLLDLTDALRERGWTLQPVAAYARIRQQITDGRARRELAKQHPQWHDKEPKGEVWDMPDGLPQEFKLYMEGAIAEFQGDRSVARTIWQRLLRLPPEERRYRTVWAHYMLGRTTPEDDPQAAEGWYHQCEAAITEGFPDSLHLGGSILGWRARDLLATDYQGAMALYRRGAALGDPGCRASLLALYAPEAQGCVDQGEYERAARLILLLLAPDAEKWEQKQGRNLLQAMLTLSDVDLRQICQVAAMRELLTAYCAGGTGRLEHFWDPSAAHIVDEDRWLAALEEAGAPPVRSAALQAWLAYSSGEYDLAVRWSQRAPATDPLVRYLNAKDALRQGKFELAVTRYEQLTQQLTDRSGFDGWNDWGYYLDPYWEGVYETEYGRTPLIDLRYREQTPDPTQIWSEYGALLVQQGRYSEALTACALYGLQARDAAYVAESLLSTQELIEWVDAHAPPEMVRANNWLDGIRDRMRWLLARRLMREGRFDLALSYFTAEWRPIAERLIEELRLGRDPFVPPTQRAAALWQAAQITRHQGMELYGTELFPDNALESGRYPEAGAYRARSEGIYSISYPDSQVSMFKVAPVFPPATDAESQRYEATGPHPTARYHYRNLAADLAWEAASLLPDHTYAQVMVLHNGGHFIKGRDPKMADRFYKAMVNQNRGIPFVEQADQERWFLKVRRITWDSLPPTHGNLLYSLP